MASGNHALVLGASGISGWALLKEAREYPTSDFFKRITGTTNRPLTLQQAQIPEDPRINLVNGVDFTKNVGEVKKLLQEKINDISTVTHVFFTAYISKDTFEALREVNTELIKNAIEAISALAPNLKFVVLQTGGKAYGVEFSDKLPIEPPLKESQPRIPKPYSDNIFYYSQWDTMNDLSKNASWTFCEVRPDVIIGYVPGDNAMDCARGIALFLSLWKVVFGANSKVPFPGTQQSWTNKHTDTFQDMLAKFEIHAATNPEKCGKGEAFNIADGPVTTWEEKWPALCEYFGLRGAGPGLTVQGKKWGIEEFVKEHGSKWNGVVKEQGLKMNAMEKYQWPFLGFVMIGFDFDRQYDLSKARSVGFNEQIHTIQSFYHAFDRMKEAKIIPS